MILRYTGSHGMLVALVSYDIVIYLLCVCLILLWKYEESSHLSVILLLCVVIIVHGWHICI